MLYSRTLFFVRSIRNRLHLLTPTSHSIHPPTPSPWATTSLFSMQACMLSHFSSVLLFATQWTVTCQAPLSMGFSWQEYWSELPFPSPLFSIDDTFFLLEFLGSLFILLSLFTPAPFGGTNTFLQEAIYVTLALFPGY